MSDAKPTGLALMRVPFPENQISMLPKPMKKRDEMDKLPKANCKVCGGYHATSMMLHLAYVGHAALTDRLLDADPAWSWEPLSLDAMGYPALDKDGGMWIRLTVCGVSRLGYGDAQGKTGGDAMKERIGDALRNAAMRFGAALDLWHKGELHIEETADTGSKKGNTAPPDKTDDSAYIDRVKAALKAFYGDDKAAALAKVEELTSFIPQGKTEADRVKGVRDFTKLTGKRLQILAHSLEKLSPVEICNECRKPLTNGACRNLACPDGRPE